MKFTPKLLSAFCFAASWFGWATLAIADESAKPSGAVPAIESLQEGKVFFLQSAAEKRMRGKLAQPTEFDFR